MISKDKLISIVENELHNQSTDMIIDLLEQRGYNYAQIADMLGYTIDKGMICIWPDPEITEERLLKVKEKYSDEMKYWSIEIIWYKEMAFVRPTKWAVLCIDDIESELVAEKDYETLLNEHGMSSYDIAVDDALTSNDID